MNQIYKRLFSAYGDSILRNVENFDDLEFQKALERFPLTAKQRLEIMDVIFDHYYQWSMDAFTLGLHLGISLLNSEIRRPAPDKG